MFGYWKREAYTWKKAYVSIDARLGETRRERDVARDLARQLRGQLSAADLQLAAERQDDEALRAKLKTAQAGLDHATHCYEQCELDRQALARERDAAKADLARATRAYTIATRDLERIHLISFEHVTEGTFATPEPTETASAGPDPADESDQARVPVPGAGCGIPGCADCGVAAFREDGRTCDCCGIPGCDGTCWYRAVLQPDGP